MPPGHPPYGYDPGAFPPFAVAVDVVLFTVQDDVLKVLLIERGGEPYLGAWALPGGFVLPEEDLDRAAARELMEETGLREGAWHLEQFAAYGAPGRDPRMRVVTVAYWAVCAHLPAPRGGGDAFSAALVPVERVESGAVRLAFDHEQIVRDALERTRSRLEDTALAAKFCPPEFTISELRRVYEAVWGVSLDPGNFQRFVRASGAFEKRPDPAPASEAQEPPPEFAFEAERAPLFSPPPPSAPRRRKVVAESQPLYPWMVREDTGVSWEGIEAAHSRPPAKPRKPRRGRPAALWRARRTDSGRPGASRTFARLRRPAKADALTPFAAEPAPYEDDDTGSPSSEDE